MEIMYYQEMDLSNLHPKYSHLPLYVYHCCLPDISGFHATQSPMMARCMRTQKDGRRVFYGAMVAEGIIALIWAGAGVALYKTTGGLAEALLLFLQTVLFMKYVILY